MCKVSYALTHSATANCGVAAEDTILLQPVLSWTSSFVVPMALISVDTVPSSLLQFFSSSPRWYPSAYGPTSIGGVKCSFARMVTNKCFIFCPNKCHICPNWGVNYTPDPRPVRLWGYHLQSVSSGVFLVLSLHVFKPPQSRFPAPLCDMPLVSP